MRDAAASTSRKSRNSQLQFFLLVGCIGLIGADRIDLFGGHGPFTLTPFLFFAPLAVLVSVVPSWLRGSTRLPRDPAIQRQLPFLALIAIFLLLTLSSIPFGLDPIRGLVAFTNLVLVSILGYCVSVQILVYPERERLIEHSVRLAIIVYAIFCVAECIAWTHGVTIDQKDNLTWIEKSFGALTVGPWVPRLTGPTGDPNRAGFVLTMYLALLDWFVPRPRYNSFMRWAIAFFLLLTLSKSAIFCWIAYHLVSATAWKRLVSRKAIMSCMILCVIAVVVYQTNKTKIDDLADMWNISEVISNRMSVDDDSSGESHLLLIERGYDMWLTSPKTLFTGIGYGSGYEVLSDILSRQSKYDNFHSLYVSTLAEQGLPAFVVIVVLLLFPLFGRGRSVQAIIAIIVFNVAYQSNAEPVLWMMLALAWSFAPPKHSLWEMFQKADAPRISSYS